MAKRKGGGNATIPAAALLAGGLLLVVCVTTWPVWVTICLALLIASAGFLLCVLRFMNLVVGPSESRTPAGTRSVAWLSSLTPSEFEHAVAQRMGEVGFRNVQVVGGRGDHGVDVRALDTYNRVVIVQCKLFRTGTVPPSTVRELHGSRPLHGADWAMLVTTARLTRQSRETAAALGIEVIDIDVIDEWFNGNHIAWN